MQTRRAILAACLSAVPLRALAGSPPGLVAMPALPNLLDGLARIDDGDPSRPRIRVVFSPLCHRSLGMYEDSRARRMDASWAWIPYAADVPSQRRSCQAALDDGTVAGLEALLRGTGPEAADRTMSGQDRAIADRAGRMFWESTRAALGTPSLVYVRRDGIAMAVRGALDPAGLDRMLDAAA
jgi:hypothetical protein